MENKPENFNEKKGLSKARSYNSSVPPRVRGEPKNTKRKSISLNEAVMSLDVALGRLKKSKLVTGESAAVAAAAAAAAAASGRSAARADAVALQAETAMDVSSDSCTTGAVNASLMSMNFSHYELVRNLSRSTATSEGAFSSATCDTSAPSDKDAFLEKYFRSIDVWNKMQLKDPSNVQFELPDQ